METPIVSLKELAISHDDGPLLTHVNLTVAPGEFIYLIGKSGAGKTSLLRTLYADHEIESGEEAIAQLEEAADLLKSVVNELKVLQRAEV